MPILIRTTSNNKDFKGLVVLLDHELKIRDGQDHSFFAQFNKIDKIKHVVLAYKEDKVVGCGALKQYSDDKTEIKRMYVHPDFRGRGIAGEILKELEKWAMELFFSECILETGKKQIEAVRLYEKSGYHPIPNFGQYEGIENSVCMRKVIL
ncbi:GNAT family N-acetyltransferase [Flavobacterium cerinum]|uniref:GNAT family N-acetyltransferase n=1 Tax=Flavobacterium cerinum TaxID=2502784 RepID=A0ABY5IQ55_9FLAO|nr:GNAT family N-acetyltransferase [Flavobacterium cerinum]UUC44967.1 GNAT family N-acetyltransferase [Flavobacterium cerinum]